MRDTALLGANSLRPEDIAAESSEHAALAMAAATASTAGDAPSRARSGSVSMSSLSKGARGRRGTGSGADEPVRPGWGIFDLVEDLRRVGARIDVPGEDGAMPSG